MRRRELIKSLGLGSGFLILGPSAFSLLQSCKNDAVQEWTPLFLSTSNAQILENILDIILPGSDIPGAKDLHIAQFIDSYMFEVASEEQKEDFVNGADDLAAAFKVEYGIDMKEGHRQQYENILRRYLKPAPKDVKEDLHRTSQAKRSEDIIPQQAGIYEGGLVTYLKIVRSLGIWAWRNSEEIGENVLWYDPVPTIYIPCGPVEELGNGKVMSL